MSFLTSSLLASLLIVAYTSAFYPSYVITTPIKRNVHPNRDEATIGTVKELPFLCQGKKIKSSRMLNRVARAKHSRLQQTPSSPNDVDDNDTAQRKQENEKKLGNLVADDEWLGLSMELTELVRLAIVEDVKKQTRDFIGKDSYKVCRIC